MSSQVGADAAMDSRLAGSHMYDDMRWIENLLLCCHGIWSIGMESWGLTVWLLVWGLEC